MLSDGGSELRLAWWREAYACAEECYCSELHFYGLMLAHFALDHQRLERVIR